MERVGGYIPNETKTPQSKKKEKTGEAKSKSSDKKRPQSADATKKEITTPIHGHITHIQPPSVGSIRSFDESMNRSAFKAKVWKTLFANVNRSIDELYYLLEEESNEDKCKDAKYLLERAALDFEKLEKRIYEQRKFDLNEVSGVSWEVRKPTSHYSSEVSHLEREREGQTDRQTFTHTHTQRERETVGLIYIPVCTNLPSFLIIKILL